MESAFARGVLAKHGWTDGAGLGKDESGIKQAIKVKIKHDNKGVGHDPGEEFTYNWWDHVFNKAANSIQVEYSKDNVTVKKSGECGPIITNKKTKTFNDKAMLYGKFIKGSMLADGNEAMESDISEEEDASLPCKPQTEEEMFAKCGGRTAHKAARHGHKLNGKLARIQEQEAEILRKVHQKPHNKSANQKGDKERNKQNSKILNN
ncbi:hypothetical protein ScPMuIL_002686 [Solemya velum]